MSMSALRLACANLRAQQAEEEKARAEAAPIAAEAIAFDEAEASALDDDNVAEEIGGEEFDGAHSLSAQLLAARKNIRDLETKYTAMRASRDAYKTIVEKMQAEVTEQVRLSIARLSRRAVASGSKQPEADEDDDEDDDDDDEDNEDDEATEMTRWLRILASQEQHLGDDCLRRYTSERLAGNSVSLYFNADATADEWVKAIVTFTKFHYVTIYDERGLTILGKDTLGIPTGPLGLLADWGKRYRAPSDSETLRAATLLKRQTQGNKAMRYATRKQPGIYKRPSGVIPSETSSDESDEEQHRAEAIAQEESNGPILSTKPLTRPSAPPAKKLRPPPRERVRT